MAYCEFQQHDDCYRCSACGQTVSLSVALPIHSWCAASKEPRPEPPKYFLKEDGPGSELKAILASLNIDRLQPECPTCNWWAMEMNAWGVEGCRENFALIVGRIRESYDNLHWADKIKAALKATATGLALHIDPRDPPRSLVELAISRAAAKQKPAGDAQP